MKKIILILSIIFSASISAANFSIDESKFPSGISPLPGNFTDNLCYTDCQKYAGHYFYLVNSPQVRRSHFFVKNFKSEKYIVNEAKLDKYRLFEKYNFADFADKVYRVTKVRFVKVDRNWSYNRDFIEFTLEDIENPKITFKFLNDGEFRKSPMCPFVDIALYKYHQDKYDRTSKYKIQSKAITGAFSTYHDWWSFKGVVFDDNLYDLVYVFDSDQGKQGYISVKDAEKALLINEAEWQALCDRKDEDYARCKLEHTVRLGMSRVEVLDVMGKPDGVAYDSRNIHTGYTVYRFGKQWVEMNDDKVIDVDLYQTLWKKGDVALIEFFTRKLY